jgi:hypothetical protein
VTSDNYLTAGVGYAYKAHRDTWYAAPMSQINFWMPIYDGLNENSMSIYPEYWKKAIINSSEIHDYDEWCNEGRKLAGTLINYDNRKHPLPLETVNDTTETRFVLAASEILAFSGAHLHATAPNTSGKTRFSIDFRTIHIEDTKNKRGAKNIDTKSSGTTLFDFLKVEDFEKINKDVINSFG